MTNETDMAAPESPSDAGLNEVTTSPDFFDQHEGQLGGYLSKEASTALRVRQQSRARVMGLLLGAAAILFFAITIVRTGGL